MNHSFADHSPGTSFKGSMAYVLHDKRDAESGPHPTSQDRVAWTETRNLATDRPETATRLMIATAKDADRLKEQAGIKKTGRKGSKTVKTFALSWHPDEAAGLGRAEMTRAADAALKAIGMENHQAVIVAHRDTAHPHVHVVVNRVDPETGKMAPCGPKENRALDRWAYEYERDRGNIVSPNRAAKHERIDAGRRRNPDAAKRKIYVQQKQHDRAEKATERRKAVSGAPDLLAAQAAAGSATGSQHSPATILRDLGEDQKRQHKAEWDELKAGNQAAKERVYASHGHLMKDEAARHKARTRPAWSKQFREQKSALRARTRMEKSVIGNLALAFTAAREQKRTGQDGGRSLLALTAMNMVSRERRETVFRAVEVRDRAALAQVLNVPLDATMQKLRDSRTQALSRNREEFGVAREALIVRQNGERSKIREAWQQVRARDDKGRPRAVHELEKQRKSREQQRTDRSERERSRAADVEPQLTPNRRQETAREALANLRRDRNSTAKLQDKSRNKNWDQER